jgi:predicted nucleotidyltransferase
MRATRENILLFLSDIKQKLSSSGIVEIGLFGSYARDEAGVYSDIDIAIKKEQGYLVSRSAYDYFEEVSSIKNQIKKQFQKNSDIFDLDSNSSMKSNILKDLIYV